MDLLQLLELHAHLTPTPTFLANKLSPTLKAVGLKHRAAMVGANLFARYSPDTIPQGLSGTI
jgi:hypothetical protein